MKKVNKCESRAKFLSKCIENKIIPKSLLVRAPKGIPSQDPHTRNNFKNAAFGASMKNLHIAHTDARKHAKEEKQRYKEHCTGPIYLLVSLNVTKGAYKITLTKENHRL